MDHPSLNPEPTHGRYRFIARVLLSSCIFGVIWSLVLFQLQLRAQLSLGRGNLSTTIVNNSTTSVAMSNSTPTSPHNDQSLRPLRPPILYGHVHIAKTGGTSLNVMLANKFERVCGHKGYSYDAYADNERAKRRGGTVYAGGRTRVMPPEMEEIGFEDCDYISNEINWSFWNNTFGGGKFHGMQMELHVPCRSTIDHVMSQCNYRSRNLTCSNSSDVLFESVKHCLVFVQDRFNHNLLKDFDNVRCFDFETQFTDYAEYMSGILQERRFESTPQVKRETNKPRTKANECIWKYPDMMKRVEDYLSENTDYYHFCKSCMGSENEIMLGR